MISLPKVWAATAFCGLAFLALVVAIAFDGCHDDPVYAAEQRVLRVRYAPLGAGWARCACTQDAQPWIVDLVAAQFACPADPAVRPDDRSVRCVDAMASIEPGQASTFQLVCTANQPRPGETPTRSNVVPLVLPTATSVATSTPLRTSSPVPSATALACAASVQNRNTAPEVDYWRVEANLALAGRPQQRFLGLGGVLCGADIWIFRTAELTSGRMRLAVYTDTLTTLVGASNWLDAAPLGTNTIPEIPTRFDWPTRPKLALGEVYRLVLEAEGLATGNVYVRWASSSGTANYEPVSGMDAFHFGKATGQDFRFVLLVAGEGVVSTRTPTPQPTTTATRTTTPTRTVTPTPTATRTETPTPVSTRTPLVLDGVEYCPCPGSTP